MVLFKFFTLLGVSSLATLWGFFPSFAVYCGDLLELWAARFFGETYFTINPKNSLIKIPKLELAKLAELANLEKLAKLKLGEVDDILKVEPVKSSKSWVILKSVCCFIIIVTVAAIASRISD